MVPSSTSSPRWASKMRIAAWLLLMMAAGTGLVLTRLSGGRPAGTSVGSQSAEQSMVAPLTAPNLLQNASFEHNWFNRAFAMNRRFLLLQASDLGVGEGDGHIDHWRVE